MSTSAGSSVGAPTDEALVAKPTLGVAVVQGFASISTSEAPVVTSDMRQLMVQLAPVFLGGTRILLPSSESTSSTIVETRSASALAGLHQLWTSWRI